MSGSGGLCRRGVPPFADDEEYFVFQVVREGYSAQLERAHPSRHFVLAHSVEHFAELFYLLVRISVRLPAAEGVKILVFVVFYVAAHGGQQAFLFAHFVLAAAAGGARRGRWAGGRAAFGVAAFVAVGGVAQCQGYEEQAKEGEGEREHLFRFWGQDRAGASAMAVRRTPTLRRSSQKAGYDLETTSAWAMATLPSGMAAGARAMAMRWSS